MIHAEFEAVIGLEVHAQLSTQSKIFCSCPARPPSGVSVADIAANANTCPICAGHPGTLPVLNRTVLEYAIRAGLATNSEIRNQSLFARKNYFYPDLPKGYQISQYEFPICEKGSLEIETSAGSKRIGIRRIHMEEDAGKNIHLADFSVVNLNRAGVPLIEIVSEPEIRSPEEAGSYLRALHTLVTCLGICDGNMQEGNFRCDANVSVMPIGSKVLGTRVEIKNVNSFRFVEKAIGYEINRQIQVVRLGQKVVQETRTYDSAQNKTMPMRSKEEAEDYRYFSDPDLIPLCFDPTWVQEIRKHLPELPDQRRARYIEKLGLSPYDAGVLASSRSFSEFFESALALLRNEDPKSSAKAIANWLSGEITRLMNEESIELTESKLRPEHIAGVIRLIQVQTLSSTNAKQAVAFAWKTGESIQTIVEREGLVQVSEPSFLDSAVQKVIAAFPGQVAEYRSGKEKLIGFFVGQVMKETGGKANPAAVQEMLKKKLST